MTYALPETAMPNKVKILPFKPPQQSVPGHGFFERVFESHHDALKRFILRFGVGEQQSHDISQEVYLRIVRQNEPDKLKQSPRAYLYTIATNLVRDYIRKNRRTRQDMHVSYEEQSIPSSVLSPEQDADMRRKLDQLKGALMELPLKKRRVFLLNRFQGMSCRQISEELGLPFRTTQRYLNEVLAYCQSRMRQYRE